MSNDSISQAIIHLFEKEMFYAEIILQMRRIVTERIPTAGVRIKDTIELLINPKFFETLTLKERVAVLKHECEHILRNHIGRSKELHPEVYSDNKDVVDNIISNAKHKVMNIAADCAINYNMMHLPEGAVYPKTFELKDNETFEWYLTHLKDNEKLKDLNNFDDHSTWSESEGDKEVLKEKIKQAINKAAEKARAAGRMTSEHELLVSKLNEASVNWREQLKRFVARSLQVSIESSKKKRNRRYGIMFPGEVKIEDLHIGVAIDTSGSISDEELNQFMSEIGQIAKYAKVTVVEADTEIKNHYVYKPNKEYLVKGRGGTAYQPAFDFFNSNKEKIDAMIYFGDMDCYDTNEIKRPSYMVLWAIVGSQKPPAPFGGIIHVKTKNT